MTTKTAPALSAASLLQLMWLASPALPVGGFSYSEVLEAAVERAGVATESIASDWLADQLQAFVDEHPDFEVPIERLATWLARGGTDDVDE